MFRKLISGNKISLEIPTRYVSPTLNVGILLPNIYKPNIFSMLFKIQTWSQNDCDLYLYSQSRAQLIFFTKKNEYTNLMDKIYLQLARAANLINLKIFQAQNWLDQFKPAGQFIFSIGHILFFPLLQDNFYQQVYSIPRHCC